MNDHPVPLANRTWREIAPWWLLLPLACQASFGWIGFNPTDDGWLQAVARRLLEGEVPHRDFIFLRPALSAYLQVPVVWLGGDHVIWWSRLWGWLELAAIAWLWSGIVGLRGVPRGIGYVGATLLSAHTFPVMAWHTIDGILFCTIAVRLAQRGWLRSAFLCVGCAALCRQNFAVFAPLLLCGLGGPVRGWFAAGFWSALPALLYLAALAAVGAAGDFVLQIGSSGDAFLTTAFMRPLSQPALWLGLLLGALSLLHLRVRPRSGVIWFVAITLILATLLANGPFSIRGGSHILFGACAVWCLAARERLLAWTALGLGWATMISMGYGTPALAAAPLLLVFARLTLGGRENERGVTIGVLVALLAVVTAFTWARLRFPYCDAPAWTLKWDAGSALPGASGLHTNPRTIANLAELRELTLDREARRIPYVVLTDFSAHWVRSGQRNLLPVDWPSDTEIGPSPAVRQRFWNALENLPPETEVFVQRYTVSLYGSSLLPIDPTWRYFHAQQVLRDNWQKRGETRFFEIFVRPARLSPPPPAQP